VLKPTKGMAEKYPVEITTRQLENGATFKCTTWVTPQLRLQRAIEEILAQGETDKRIAMCRAVERLHKLALANSATQERLIECFKARQATSRQVRRIGLTDLLLAIGSWEHPQGPIDAKQIRLAAQRERLRFVKTELGWQERKKSQADLIADEEIDIQMLIDIDKIRDSLTPDQQLVFDLKREGYYRDQITAELARRGHAGWTKRKTESVWRSLAADRDGHIVQNQLDAWILIRNRYRFASKKPQSKD
jgi:hypothetical protein